MTDDHDDKDARQADEIGAFLLAHKEEEILAIREMLDGTRTQPMPEWARLVVLKVMAKDYANREGYKDEWTVGL
jgi:hypothetical protein